jgi:hypothetical protein
LDKQVSKPNETATQEEVVKERGDRVENNKRKQIKCCDHSNIWSYQKFTTKSYLTPIYLKNNKFAIRRCIQKKSSGELCGVDFCGCIGESTPVMACEQALMVDHECMHAICNECFKEASSQDLAKEQPGGRKSRRRTTTESTNYTEI